MTYPDEPDGDDERQGQKATVVIVCAVVAGFAIIAGATHAAGWW